MNEDLNEPLSAEEIERSTIKQARINDILFLPIMALLALVPLIVRMQLVVASQAVHLMYNKPDITDFYSQGKAMAIIFITMMMGIVMFFCYQKEQLKKFKDLAIYFIAAGVFLAFTALSTVFSEYNDVAIWGIPDRAEGLIIIVCYIIAMFYTLYAVKNTKQYRYIMFALGLLVIIATIIGVFQYLGTDLFTTELGRKIIIPQKFAALREHVQTQFPSKSMTVTMYNPNYVGSFATLMLPLFITPLFFKINIKLKIGSALLSLCSVILLIGCNSRAGFIGVAASIILGIIIFSKSVFQKKKLILGSITILIILFITANVITEGLMLSRISMLASDVATLLSPAEANYDYRDNLTVRDIQTAEDKAVISLQDHSITVRKQGEGLIFNDENNQRIIYSLDGNRYSTRDERFEAISFLCLYANTEEELLGGFGLLVDEMITFIFEATNQDGIHMIDNYTQERIKEEEAPAIGFKGKESIGSGRGYIWSRSIPMLKDTLLIGKGPDTYIMWFPQDEYFAKWHALGHPLIIVDKPHNMYLQIGINQGLIALIAFLTLVMAYILDSIKLYAFKLKYKEETMAGIAIFLAVIGYLMAALFNDSAISIAPIFWVLLGAGIAFNYIVKHQGKEIYLDEEYQAS